jgi:NADH dehydrogenase (ubiquinone) flavoprotein 1
VQGLIRHFKKDIEDRIDNPEAFDHEAAFQRAWSGDPFDNQEWASKHGAGKTYASSA